jgi:hypothetical protein
LCGLFFGFGITAHLQAGGVVRTVAMSSCLCSSYVA